MLGDGMYLIHSSFYANAGLRTLDGKHIGALYGFILRLESVIREYQPAAIAVAFDSPQKGFRWKLLPSYKEKRQKTPEELQQQVPLVKEYLHLRSMTVLEAPELEADDLIALTVNSKVREYDRIIIYSADKDLFQLVNDRVFILEPKSKILLDREGIRAHFGVYPEQIVDYLALVGDSSDNIEGVAGVGEKTALKFFQFYRSIDQFFEDPHRLDPKLSQKIIAGRDKIAAARRLLDLQNLPFKLELQIPPFANKFCPELYDFYRRFAFSSFLKGVEEQTDSENSLPPVKIITGENELKTLVEKIRAAREFYFDLETTSLDFWKGEIIGMGIAVNDELFYLPVRSEKGKQNYSALNWQTIRDCLQPVFNDPQIKKSGHNIKFDLLFLKEAGMDFAGIGDDSMLLSYLLYPNRRSHNLKELALALLNKKMVTFEELQVKDPQQLPGVELQKIASYCADDAYSSSLLVKKLKPELETYQLNSLYQEIELRLLPVLMEMEYQGIEIDVQFLNNCRQQLQQLIKRCEEEIFSLAGYELNLNSQQQLGVLLFEKLKLPVGKKTRKSGALSTDNEVLESLRAYPVVEKIITYRTARKLLSTYVERLLERIDERNRVHTSFNQTVTATGRLSSSDPNLQNIPVQESFGVNLRSAFLASRGQYLLSADYSQIELRVLAHFADDPLLKEAFFNDLDIHSYTADLVFKDAPLSSQEKRKRAKIINFSILYGKTPFSLSRELNIEFQQAKDFIDNYFNTYRKVRDFINQVIAEAEKTQFVRTICGRSRQVNEIVSSNRNLRENARRIAVNTVIQGSAADLIKIAMIRIFDKLKSMKSRLLLQVHDELVFSYPQEEENALFKIVKTEMETAIPLKVPLKVSLKKGKNWGELNEVKE